MTSALLIALFVGLSVPVIGAGVALSLGASAPAAGPVRRQVSRRV